jgi:hypothetical protein
VLLVLAPAHGDPARGRRRQSQRGGGPRLGVARRCAALPGAPVRLQLRQRRDPGPAGVRHPTAGGSGLTLSARRARASRN